MTPRQIEIFVAVMKAGTVSRAAERLGVTQPGLSRALAELERTLGFSLFDRVRGRVVPTPEGRLFYQEVQATYRGMDLLRASAARIRDQGAGQLRVASLSALGSSLVPRALRSFHDRHPEIAVTLMVLPSRDVRNGIASGEFDVGLAADEIDVSGVAHQPFTAARLLCALPVGHALSTRACITPVDLDRVPFVAYVPEDRARQRLDLVFADASSQPAVIIETLYATTVCALVAEGVGVGLVSPYAAVGYDPARVVFRPFEPAVHSRSLLILPLDRPKSGLVRAFIDCLMAAR